MKGSVKAELKKNSVILYPGRRYGFTRIFFDCNGDTGKYNQ
jgi:hypothetical protein